MSRCELCYKASIQPVKRTATEAVGHRTYRKITVQIAAADGSKVATSTTAWSGTGKYPHNVSCKPSLAENRTLGHEQVSAKQMLCERLQLVVRAVVVRLICKCAPRGPRLCSQLVLQACGLPWPPACVPSLCSQLVVPRLCS